MTISSLCSGSRPLMKYLLRYEQISFEDPLKNFRSTNLDGSKRLCSVSRVLGVWGAIDNAFIPAGISWLAL